MPWVDEKKCIKCKRCVEVCPKGAISMDDDSMPVIDQSLCNRCGRCLLECPVSAIRPNSENPSLVGGGGNYPRASGMGKMTRYGRGGRSG